MPAKKKAIVKKTTKPSAGELLKQLEFEKRKSARLADALDTEKLNHQASAEKIKEYKNELNRALSRPSAKKVVHVDQDGVIVQRGFIAPELVPEKPTTIEVKYSDIAVGAGFIWKDAGLHQRIVPVGGSQNALHKESGCTYELRDDEMVTPV